MRRRALTFLTPLMPEPDGNGLAMRAGLQLEALAACFDVSLVVVPVAGGSRESGWAERHASAVGVVTLGDPDAIRKGIVELVGNPVWRDRLRRAEPLPQPARVASPALAAAVAAVAETRAAPVHAFRAYLAPLAVAVAERTDAPWLTLDLDDDDEALLEQQGRAAEAEAYGRLIAVFGPAFAWLTLASPDEATAVGARHGLSTAVLQNAVHVESGRVVRSRREDVGVRRGSDPGSALILLLVGNLTYEPNVEAAELLAREVLPRVRRLLHVAVQVELVGRFEPGGRVAALAGLDGVVLRGHVDDLAHVYARADLAVVPLRHGAGTRIKVLEALAFGVPVVTTPVGAAGLGAEDGRELLLGSSVDELAAAVARVALDGHLASALAREGRAFVAERFSSAAFDRRLQELMAGLGPS